MEGTLPVTMNILQSDILAGIKANSYYIGEARKDAKDMMETAARLQASNDNNDILLKFAKSASTELVNLLTKMLGSTTSAWTTTGDTPGVTFTVNAVANFMTSQTDTLKNALENYIENSCLMNWMAINKPDEVKWFEIKLQSLQDDIRIICSHRSKPTL